MTETLRQLKHLFFHVRRRAMRGRFDTIIPLFSLSLKIVLKKDFSIKNFDDTGIDVVIPTVSKDFPLLEIMLEALKRNLCQPINKIYVISRPNPELSEFCLRNKLTFVDEKSVLGYGKESINYYTKDADRRGWILQQLIKLSGDKVVERENYVIVDSDTVLVGKNSFLEDGRFVFFQNTEWHEPYFKSFQKMFGYQTINKLSFTSHMMIFNKTMLREMKEELEKVHGTTWDQVYLSTVDPREPSCVSDYDTYANWVLIHHPELFKQKPLYNKSVSRSELKDLAGLEKQFSESCKTISFHSYLI